jgi:hypothetical protein
MALLGSPTAYFTNIADTGSTGHFFSTDTSNLINIRPATSSIPVTLPNGHKIYSKHIADLDVPTLPIAARTAHIFPDLSAGTLISIGLFCDAGCVATYTADTVAITLNQQLILSGPRIQSSKLWHLDLHPPSSNTTVATAYDNATKLSASPSELVAFGHAALFSPSLSTLCTALDINFLIGFPGLTSQLVSKYAPASTAMVKGHLDQT